MHSDMRIVLAVAVPAVAALLGLLWVFHNKKRRKGDKSEPAFKDKSSTSKPEGSMVSGAANSELLEKDEVCKKTEDKQCGYLNRSQDVMSYEDAKNIHQGHINIHNLPFNKQVVGFPKEEGDATSESIRPELLDIKARFLVQELSKPDCSESSGVKLGESHNLRSINVGEVPPLAAAEYSNLSAPEHGAGDPAPAVSTTSWIVANEKPVSGHAECMLLQTPEICSGSWNAAPSLAPPPAADPLVIRESGSTLGDASGCRTFEATSADSGIFMSCQISVETRSDQTEVTSTSSPDLGKRMKDRENVEGAIAEGSFSRTSCVFDPESKISRSSPLVDCVSTCKSPAGESMEYSSFSRTNGCQLSNIEQRTVDWVTSSPSRHFGSCTTEAHDATGQVVKDKPAARENVPVGNSVVSTFVSHSNNKMETGKFHEVALTSELLRKGEGGDLESMRDGRPSITGTFEDLSYGSVSVYSEDGGVMSDCSMDRGEIDVEKTSLTSIGDDTLAQELSLLSSSAFSLDVEITRPEASSWICDHNTVEGVSCQQNCHLSSIAAKDALSSEEPMTTCDTCYSPGSVMLDEKLPAMDCSTGFCSSISGSTAFDKASVTTDFSAETDIAWRNLIGLHCDRVHCNKTAADRDITALANVISDPDNQKTPLKGLVPSEVPSVFYNISESPVQSTEKEESISSAPVERVHFEGKESGITLAETRFLPMGHLHSTNGTNFAYALGNTVSKGAHPQLPSSEKQDVGACLFADKIKEALLSDNVSNTRVQASGIYGTNCPDEPDDSNITVKISTSADPLISPFYKPCSESSVNVQPADISFTSSDSVSDGMLDTTLQSLGYIDTMDVQSLVIRPAKGLPDGQIGQTVVNVNEPNLQFIVTEQGEHCTSSTEESYLAQSILTDENDHRFSADESSECRPAVTGSSVLEHFELQQHEVENFCTDTALQSFAVEKQNVQPCVDVGEPDLKQSVTEWDMAVMERADKQAVVGVSEPVLELAVGDRLDKQDIVDLCKYELELAVTDTVDEQPASCVCEVHLEQSVTDKQDMQDPIGVFDLDLQQSVTDEWNKQAAIGACESLTQSVADGCMNKAAAGDSESDLEQSVPDMWNEKAAEDSTCDMDKQNEEAFLTVCEPMPLNLVGEEWDEQSIQDGKNIHYVEEATVQVKAQSVEEALTVQGKEQTATGQYVEQYAADQTEEQTVEAATVQVKEQSVEEAATVQSVEEAVTDQSVEQASTVQSVELVAIDQTKLQTMEQAATDQAKEQSVEQAATDQVKEKVATYLGDEQPMEQASIDQDKEQAATNEAKEQSVEKAATNQAKEQSVEQLATDKAKEQFVEQVDTNQPKERATAGQTKEQTTAEQAVEQAAAEQAVEQAAAEQAVEQADAEKAVEQAAAEQAVEQAAAEQAVEQAAAEQAVEQAAAEQAVEQAAAEQAVEQAAAEQAVEQAAAEQAVEQTPAELAVEQAAADQGNEQAVADQAEKQSCDGAVESYAEQPVISSQDEQTEPHDGEHGVKHLFIDKQNVGTGMTDHMPALLQSLADTQNKPVVVTVGESISKDCITDRKDELTTVTIDINFKLPKAAEDPTLTGTIKDENDLTVCVAGSRSNGEILTECQHDSVKELRSAHMSVGEEPASVQGHITNSDGFHIDYSASSGQKHGDGTWTEVESEIQVDMEADLSGVKRSVKECSPLSDRSQRSMGNNQSKKSQKKKVADTRTPKSSGAHRESKAVGNKSPVVAKEKRAKSSSKSGKTSTNSSDSGKGHTLSASSSSLPQSDFKDGGYRGEVAPENGHLLHSDSAGFDSKNNQLLERDVTLDEAWSYKDSMQAEYSPQLCNGSKPGDQSFQESQEELGEQDWVGMEAANGNEHVELSVTNIASSTTLLAGVVTVEFNFPTELCGRLIGRSGRNVQHIKEQCGASVIITSNPVSPDFQICRIEGTHTSVQAALMMIKKKFPQVDVQPVIAPNLNPLIMPDMIKLNLPDGVSVKLVVSNIVNAGHIFVHLPNHPTYASLDRLCHCMNSCYSKSHGVPPLPRPVETGLICAAESGGCWFRVEIVSVYPETDECDISFVDYGGYDRVALSSLKQIRSDFMTLPFQAVECYMANITPLQGEEYFSENASSILHELTAGKLLDGQVITREGSIPYVHLYQISARGALLVNRAMVNREVVRWIEIF